ncbi:universal stress protein [Promicromonospora sp. MEB111]|uniref:universal stress protein n=1 Tax=Promicromonospora sp. MEB111 TaxID=3040301 RepID=UPI002550AF9C|nr:universal stress protein [Promicromonospora sp. MEB111]
MSDTRDLPVLVGVDGSDSATRAVRWAAREAARRGAPLVLVSVWTPVPPGVPHAATLGPYEDGLIEQGRQWLADAAAAAAQEAPDVPAGTRLASGSVAGQLVGRSAAAGLVVLGSRGLGGFTGLLVGSIAVAVATHGHCPVVVVRGTPAQEGPVVVGVDGSPTSQAAIRFAFDAAALRDAPLVAVHAWRDASAAARHGVQDQRVQEHGAEALERWLADARADHPEVRVERVVAPDGPTASLLDRAEGARLVVVGSRGRGGFRGLLLGSTSQALIYHAPCPVAVVPPAE